MKNNKKRWIWVIIALVSLAAIGGLVYFLTKPKKTNQSQAINQSNSKSILKTKQTKQALPQFQQELEEFYNKVKQGGKS